MVKQEHYHCNPYMSIYVYIYRMPYHPVLIRLLAVRQAADDFLRHLFDFIQALISNCALTHTLKFPFVDFPGYKGQLHIGHTGWTRLGICEKGPAASIFNCFTRVTASFLRFFRSLFGVSLPSIGISPSGLRNKIEKKKKCW